MELRHLRYFVAVAQTLNFTKAAARMNIAQSALSRQIGSLEDEVGASLFKRGARGVSLTEEGTYLHDKAVRILKEAEETVEGVRAVARGELGHIHVGYSPSPTVEILPPALKAFEATAPKVTVRLHDLGGNDLANQVRDEKLSFAVMQKPANGNGKGLSFELLRTYPICVAFMPKHRFAKMRAVPLAQVAVENLVVYRRSEYLDYHVMLERVFRDVSPKPRFSAECDGASTIITQVEAGRGVTITSSVFSIICGTRLKLRPLCPPPSPQQVGIVRALERDLPPAAEKICNELRAASKRLEISSTKQVGYRQGNPD